MKFTLICTFSDGSTSVDHFDSTCSLYHKLDSMLLLRSVCDPLSLVSFYVLNHSSIFSSGVTQSL